MAALPAACEIIDAAAYLAIWRGAGSTSRPDRPQDAVFRRYTTSVTAFVDDQVYPVWWTDPRRCAFVSQRDPQGVPIAFRELIRYPALCRDMLGQRRDRMHQ